MGQYDSAITLAQRLINKKGREVTVSKSTVVAADPAEPWDVTQTGTEQFTAKAVIFPVESKYVDGTTVLITDKQMYLAASDTEFPITPSCKIMDKGYPTQVISVDVLEPGEQSILYTVIVR